MPAILIISLIGWIGFTGTMNQAGTPVLNNCQGANCAVNFNQ